MDHEFHSIVERLAILEGRITPKDRPLSESKQKRPALFTNLKKDEVAEERSDDVLSQVKASLADYLKSAEDNIKQDRELIAKKKQDLDLKKKELKDLELQQKKKDKEEIDEISADAAGNYMHGVLKQQKEKEGNKFHPVGAYDRLPPNRRKGIDRSLDRMKIPRDINEAPQLNVGDPIAVSGHNEYHGEFGVVDEFAPSGKFVIIQMRNGDKVPMHISDVELTDDEGWNDNVELDEEPNQTPAGGEASAGESNATYAQGSNNTYAESAPVKTIDFPIVEMGGSVLVEIHGNERDGFNIRRAGRDLPTKFASLADAEMALDMFKARRAQQQADNEAADYIEEK